MRRENKVATKGPAALAKHWLFPLIACSGIVGVVGIVVVVAFVAGFFYKDVFAPTATPLTTLTTTPSATPVLPVITLANCYQVSFRGVVNNGDGTSTWTYFVEELACAQDLSNWMVELPTCARVIGATPSPWELVNPDPNYQLNGIKWQVGAGFSRGEFSVTLMGNLTVGASTQIGTKGPDIAIGTIAGPICAGSEPTPTLMLTATTPPTATETIIPTATAVVSPVSTLLPTVTSTLPPPTLPPPTLPPPTSPPPPVGDIVINDNDQTQTFTCNGNSVMINGNNNTITLLGSCGAVTIRGNNNKVSIQSAASITNTGNNNTINSG